MDYNSFLEKQLKNNQKIIYDYSGIFDQEIVKKYAFILTKLSKQYIVTQRRLFYVFVELGQNIGYYSDETEKIGEKNIGKGNLLVYEADDHIGFIIGNVINNKALNVFLRKCKIINSLDRDSLREFKRYQRNLIPGTNGGAHIGLIMVALTTRKKIDVDVLKIDDEYSFFSINVNVEKETT
ncbi:MAG: SiaB family protein kinase [Bacteroidales bacterium]|nr:SiaB family protein kinase [Bacteroidales bacterium]